MGEALYSFKISTGYRFSRLKANWSRTLKGSEQGGQWKFEKAVWWGWNQRRFSEQAYCGEYWLMVEKIVENGDRWPGIYLESSSWDPTHDQLKDSPLKMIISSHLSPKWTINYFNTINTYANK